MGHDTILSPPAKGNDKSAAPAPTRTETPPPPTRTRATPAGTATTNALRRISRILDALSDAERPRVVGALASLYGSTT